MIATSAIASNERRQGHDNPILRFQLTVFLIRSFAILIFYGSSNFLRELACEMVLERQIPVDRPCKKSPEPFAHFRLDPIMNKGVRFLQLSGQMMVHG